jgi:hypothetical protein
MESRAAPRFDFRIDPFSILNPLLGLAIFFCWFLPFEIFPFCGLHTAVEDSDPLHAICGSGILE